MNTTTTTTTNKSAELLQAIARKAAELEEARRIIRDAEERAAEVLSNPATSDKQKKAIETALKALQAARVFVDKVTAGDKITAEDKRQALQAVAVSYHSDKSSKIEGASSIDSTSRCDFCEKASRCPAWVCYHCYARRITARYILTHIRHAANAAILMSYLFDSRDLVFLQAGALVVRINSDGETPNATFAANVFRWARRAENKARRVGYWYKNEKAIRDGRKITERPANVILIQSSPITNKPAEWDGQSDAIFTVYDNIEEYNKAIAAGAVACAGVKCLRCGWSCYSKAARRKSSGPVYIAEMLRK